RLELRGARHRTGGELAQVAGDHLVARVAVVDDRLEDLHALLGDEGAAQAAHQLFALAGEHATGDDLDLARGPVVTAHVGAIVVGRRVPRLDPVPGRQRDPFVA